MFEINTPSVVNKRTDECRRIQLAIASCSENSSPRDDGKRKRPTFVGKLKKSIKTSTTVPVCSPRSRLRSWRSHPYGCSAKDLNLLHTLKHTKKTTKKILAFGQAFFFAK